MSDTTLQEWIIGIISIAAVIGTVVLAFFNRAVSPELTTIDGAVIGFLFGQHTAIRAVEVEHNAQLEQQRQILLPPAPHQDGSA